jgi:hypothetical protein
MIRNTLMTLALLATFAGSVVRSADEPAPLPADQFDRLHRQIKPQPGESLWMEVPWLIDIHEARQKAAAEGKPILVLSGGGATGIGAC